jgi:adenylosuccinate lyase
MKIIFTEHVMFEMERRQITKDDLKDLIDQPQQKIPGKKSRVILQKKYFDKLRKKEMLLRVIGKQEHGKFMVITAYKTSRIEKYWLKGEN